jgi:alkanesulfonate monooxygenase SsuD/methylene tetrahydromethanopterin reductase-like flavin-dependent oxidoreductase (luciferase family)
MRAVEGGWVMTDYGLPLQFGLFVIPSAAEIDEAATLVQVAEETGLDLIAIQDHPYLPRFLDTWTLMAFLAARTRRIRFFPDVANLALRPPAMLAKAAASLDRLSGGRVELGLGSGGFWDAIVGMGGPRLSPAEAVAATEEAMQVIRLVWETGEDVSFAGSHYQLRGHKPGPAPAHPVGIWLGVRHPRMLRLTGRLADGWACPLNTYVPPEQVPAMQTRIDEAARRAARAPTAIRRIYNVMGGIDAEPGRPGGLSGSVDLWADTLARWAIELGFDTFIFYPSVASPEHVERFAREVVPRTRELVAQARRAAG